MNRDRLDTLLIYIVVSKTAKLELVKMSLKDSVSASPRFGDFFLAHFTGH